MAWSPISALPLSDWQADLKGYVHTASATHHPGKDVIDAASPASASNSPSAMPSNSSKPCWPRKNDWLDTGEDIHDVVSFYKTQLPTWRKLLEALTGFGDNRDVLLKEPPAPPH